jgi:adenosylcobyric acid synthase
MTGSLLIAGTTSDAGKSLVTAALCRVLHRAGVSVAPFKAQNMSNNSAVTADGGEIGRAQALQALAAGIEPSVDMNPVLLKPGSDRRSHVLLGGHPYADVTAVSYRDLKHHLRKEVLASYDRLRAQYDVVICEGAGSPAEINLRESDLANMWLADQREVATVIVADIDRGGVFPAIYGTVALLNHRDQSLISGFIINKFRGDQRVLDPGIDMLTTLTGRRTYGVLPWLADLHLDAEDSMSLDSDVAAGVGVGAENLDVVGIKLPRLSNSTDLQALAYEPGVSVRWSTHVGDVLAADLVVLPGSRATVSDLQWLRHQGLADALVARSRSGAPVLGICGGYQMLAETIIDTVESGAGAVDGLGLLPVRVEFAEHKTLGRPVGEAYGHRVDTGYEIHHGQAEIGAGGEAFLDGCRQANVWGTTWHGAFDSDEFRRAFLSEIASVTDRDFVVAPDTRVAELRQHGLDRVADLLTANVDIDALISLIRDGAPSGLPFISPGAPR